MENTFIREVSVSYSKTRKKLVKIDHAAPIATLVRGIVKNRPQEFFIAFHLDASNQVVGHSVVTIGILNSALVHPREVFTAALLCSAAQIIVAHNHPSNQKELSAEDRAVTKRLLAAGNVLGIKLLDHVIVTDNDYYSFAREEPLLIRPLLTEKFE